jgi:hypothetical protein
MAHVADGHDLCGVIDGVDNPVGTDAQLQASLCALDTLAPVGGDGQPTPKCGHRSASGCPAARRGDPAGLPGRCRGRRPFTASTLVSIPPPSYARVGLARSTSKDACGEATRVW